MKRIKNDVIVRGFRSFLVELPTPISISYMWNYGSMLAFCLGLQIITGIFLVIHYRARTDLAFIRLIHISRDVAWGWLFHYIHANGARLFFICLYMHIGRGLYYSSYRLMHVWGTGILILFLVIITAFLGYVLPWGQISFWGATVITNLLSAIPYLGTWLVEWLWGGFSVGNPTLVRFFAFHYLFPFILVGLVLVHLIYLHETGSNMPLGLNSDVVRGEFHPYFRIRDIFGLGIMFFLMIFVVIFIPNVLGDRENFIEANSLVTPVHIQPEWYFLFAYAILRSIPNKLGGVVALVMSILVLYACLMFGGDLRRVGWDVKWKILFWWLVVIFMLLSWIGARPVEDPYIMVGQILSVLYFMCFAGLGILGSLLKE